MLEVYFTISFFRYLRGEYVIFINYCLGWYQMKQLFLLRREEYFWLYMTDVHFG